MSNDTLVVRLNGILDVVVQTFAQAGVSLPERRFVTAGQTAHDCEQVSVSFVQLNLGVPGDPGNEAVRCDGPRSVLVSVEVVRCIPTANARTGTVSVDAIDAASEMQLVDAWLLMEAATNLDDWAILADVAAGQPGGGFQSMTLNVTLLAG